MELRGQSLVSLATSNVGTFAACSSIVVDDPVGQTSVTDNLFFFDVGVVGFGAVVLDEQCSEEEEEEEEAGGGGWRV